MLYIFQEKYYQGLPSIVFGLAALSPALLALFLPDTSQSDLPDQVADAEKIDAQKNHQNVATAWIKVHSANEKLSVVNPPKGNKGLKPNLQQEQYKLEVIVMLM